MRRTCSRPPAYPLRMSRTGWSTLRLRASAGTCGPCWASLPSNSEDGFPSAWHSSGSSICCLRLISPSGGRFIPSPPAAWLAAWSCNLRRLERSVLKTAVLPKNAAKLIVRNCGNSKKVGAGHRLCCQHGVDDGLFGRLHSGLVNRIDALVTQHPKRLDSLAVRRTINFSGREGQEEVSRAGARDPSHSSDAQCGSPGYPPQLMRKQWCIGSNDHDDRAVLLCRTRQPRTAHRFLLRSESASGVVARLIGPHLPANRHPGNPELLPQAKVALNQNAHHKAASRIRQLSARRANPALEPEALHSGASADVPLRHRTGLGRGQRREYIGFGDVKAVDVIQVAVPGLRHHRQATVEHSRDPRSSPLDNGVAHRSNAVGVGDAYGIEQLGIVIQPCRAGHLTVAVQAEPAGEHWCKVSGSAGEYHGDTGADWPDPHLERATPSDQGSVPNRYSGNVRDSVQP